MSPPDKRARRPYDAPQRRAAAAHTRELIVRAAKESFEERGWAGTTVRSVSESAGVSLKTVEALFGTKAALLQAAVDYAIRGDVEPLQMPQRDSVARMEAAANAETMLEFHATHLRTINERSARIAWAVEHAAPGDPSVAELWRRMNDNRTFAIGWAARTLLAKPGRKPRLRRRDVETAFWVALDWGTYRTLTNHAGLTPDEFERWLRSYYRAAFLPA
jgi:TetR/AcrR family transcriptional regulator, regulator of autoinduction and epiphytic fitness